MALSFEKILRSGQFTFFVGSQNKAIIVHSAALAATCDYMDRLINGQMSEAEVRCAKLEDVEVEDFIRFCEYAYRGDYTVPPYRIEDIPGAESRPYLEGTQSELTLVRAGTPDATMWDWAQYERQMKKKKKKNEFEKTKSTLRTQWEERNYAPKTDPKTAILNGFIPQPNTAEHQDFTPIFLAHARLYTFAHSRLIEPLKALTLHKLHRTLVDFQIYKSRVKDITELARYAYSTDHIPDRKQDGELDDLRKLIVEFIAGEIDTIGKSIEFVQLLEEGGEFVGDFWNIARAYLT